MSNLLDKALNQATQKEVEYINYRSEIMDEIEFLNEWSDHFRYLNIQSVFRIKVNERIKRLKSIL